MPTLATLREDYAREAHELHKIFEEAGADLDMDRVKRLEGTPEEKVAEIRRRHDVVNGIAAELERLQALGNIGQLNEMRHKTASTPVERPVYGGALPALPDNGGSVLHAKGLVAYLRAHKGYQAFRDGRMRS